MTTDSDQDGVSDIEDLCPSTDLFGDANHDTKKNRLWSNSYGLFLYGNDLNSPSGVTVEDTGGCSASQIIERFHLGSGHKKFGISKSAMEDYLADLCEATWQLDSTDPGSLGWAPGEPYPARNGANYEDGIDDQTGWEGCKYVSSGC